jgi:uncharacterized protein GlcG (DUF336 family)
VTGDKIGPHSDLLGQFPYLGPPHNTRWPTIEELRKQVPAEERDAEDKRRNEEQAKLLLACLHIKGEPMTAVKLEDARRVISAAEKKAREIGQPMNIAVADEGGNIVAHVRMDNAWIGSIDISLKKAYTSRAFDIETKELAKHSQSGGEFFGVHVSNNGKIMIFAGGIPLKLDGKVVGAIGVSGGSGDQDHAVAAAGAAAF